MRVVVDLDGGEDDMRAQIGFWAARGAAGFAVRGLGDEAVGRLRQAAGGGVVIADSGGGQLRVKRIPEVDAAGLRGWLAGAVKGGVLLEDGESQLGYARAAMVLASGVAGRVGADAVLAPAAAADAPEFSAEEMLLWVPKEKAAKGGMVEWVRELNELRRQSAALRTGKATFLDFDARGVVGWVILAPDGRETVVVVANVSGKAVTVDAAGMVKGTLKMLLRSDGAGMSGTSKGWIGLDINGVFVGRSGN